MKASARKIIDLTEDDPDAESPLQPPIDPIEPPIDVAAVLRQARAHKRVSLARAVEGTNIARQYLQALENGGSAECFPAPAYARFFLADYARFLGLDPGPLLRSFDDRQEDLAEPILEPITEPWSRTRKWTGRILVAACAATLIGLVADHFASSNPKPTIPTLASGSGPAVAGARALGARAPHHGGATGQATFTGVKVMLGLSAPCWVEAKSDGATVLQQTLPAGRSVTLHASKSLDLTLGNAGGVRMRVNGKKMATGLPGQVIHIGFAWQDGRLVTKL